MNEYSGGITKITSKTIITVSFVYWAVCSWDMEYAYFNYTINDGPQQTGWQAPWWHHWWGQEVHGWVETDFVDGKECTHSANTSVFNRKTVDIEIDLTNSSAIYVECLVFFFFVA